MTIKERIELYKKNHLTESETSDLDGVAPVVQPTIDKTVASNPSEGLSTGISNTISALIQDEWEAIDGYKNAIAMLETLNETDPLIVILDEVLADEYNHVGALEKALTLVTPEASKIEDGKIEAIDEINKLSE